MFWASLSSMDRTPLESLVYGLYVYVSAPPKGGENPVGKKRIPFKWRRSALPNPLDWTCARPRGVFLVFSHDPFAPRKHQKVGPNIERLGVSLGVLVSQKRPFCRHGTLRWPKHSTQASEDKQVGVSLKPNHADLPAIQNRCRQKPASRSRLYPFLPLILYGS